MERRPDVTLRYQLLRGTVLLGLLGAAAAACTETSDLPTLHDDIGLAESELVDSMEPAYALGSRFHVHASQAEDGWSLESADPGVLRLTPMPATEGARALEHEAAALGAGETRLRVLDASGAVLHEVPVVVRAPDRLVLSLDGDPVGGDEPAPRVLVGQPVLLRVELFAGDEVLAARGRLAALEPLGDPAIETVPLGHDEGLRVTLAGSEPAGLAVEDPGPAGLRRVRFEPVGEAVVERVELDHLGPTGDATTALVRARTVDAEGHRVHGAGFSWSLAGAPLAGVDEREDLLLYTHREDAAERPLVARFGALEASLPVRLEGAPTLLRGSDLTCSVTPGGAPVGVAVWVAALLAAGWAALRRARRGSRRGA